MTFLLLKFLKLKENFFLHIICAKTVYKLPVTIYNFTLRVHHILKVIICCKKQKGSHYCHYSQERIIKTGIDNDRDRPLQTATIPNSNSHFSQQYFCFISTTLYFYIQQLLILLLSIHTRSDANLHHILLNIIHFPFSWRFICNFQHSFILFSCFTKKSLKVPLYIAFST